MNNFQIANFKSFSEMQKIPLKPITIIFGPNSSGKSSIIHSLLLARHGVDTQSLNATYPSIAGEAVDLGGFTQYIHRRNPENRLQFGMNFTIASLPAKLANDLPNAQALGIRLSCGIPLDDNGQPRQGARPFTQSCEYSIDGKLFMRMTRTEPGADFSLAQLNREHPVFEPILQAMLLSSRSHQSLNTDDSGRLAALIDSIVPQMFFKGKSDFLPGTEYDPDLLSRMDRMVAEHNDDASAKLGDLGRSVRLFLPRTLMRLHSGIQDAMTQALKSLSYLGPLRSLPPRHTAFLDPKLLGEPASGGKAWIELSRNIAVREKINLWLAKLQTPYRLTLLPYFNQEKVVSEILRASEYVLEQFIREALPSISEEEMEVFKEQAQAYHAKLLECGPADDLENPDLLTIQEGFDEMVQAMANQTHNSELFEGVVQEQLQKRTESDGGDLQLYDINRKTYVTHRDVGIGVSQVLPVLVEAYASRNRLLAMEQPEIHLHPALQAELADVFIESALGENKNRFLLETHSEHLILRILRRIRESRNSENPTIKPSDISVLYVEPSSDGAEVYEIEISDDGQILSPWPGGFFPERMKEMFGEI